MLQVLTGTVKGARLKVPKGMTIRPTTSRVKKTIFDTLGDISDLNVLDIFAGSGSLGIEALSREAAHVTFIEKNPLVLKLLKENVTHCGFLEQATFICAHYESALKRLKGKELFGLIFIDPPYALYDTMEVRDFILPASELMEEDGVIVIEHNYKMEDTPAGFTRVTKPFGGTQLSFFRKGDE